MRRRLPLGLWVLASIAGLACAHAAPPEFQRGDTDGVRADTHGTTDPCIGAGTCMTRKVSTSPTGNAVMVTARSLGTRTSAVDSVNPVAATSSNEAFATWSTTRIATAQYITLSNGNLTATGTDSGMVVTDYFIEASTANNYWEVHIDLRPEGPPLHNLLLGISPITETTYDMNFPGYVTGYGLKSNGDTYANSVRAYPCPPPPGSLDCLLFGTGDTIKMLLKHGSLYFGKVGGAWVGDPVAETGAWATGISGLYSPGFSAYQSYGYDRIVTANFGASPWADTPPAGAAGWLTDVDTIFVDGFDGD